MQVSVLKTGERMEVLVVSGCWRNEAVLRGDVVLEQGPLEELKCLVES